MSPSDRISEAQNAKAGLIFDKTLDLIKELDIIRESKRVFLVYAHESHSNAAKADAKVAQQLIKWLDDLNGSIVSDRTASGNQCSVNSSSRDIGSSEDILQSQLCLLPKSSEIPCEKVDYVILCGSEQLKHYEQSDYYQKTYKPTLQDIYLESTEESFSKLSAYVNSQGKLDGFHHVLTELAFLDLRMLDADHGVIPLLLNGSPETALPRWRTEATNIRIEDPIWREAGQYNTQLIYQNPRITRRIF